MPTQIIRADLPFISTAAYNQLYAQALAVLKGGGLLIYPTETLYALGCASNAKEAINLVYQLKKRSHLKQMPLLVGNLDQADRICRLEGAPAKLLAKFWPGPLTLILPGRKGVPAKLLDKSGELAIRVSSSVIAASLALDCGHALISSSANISGQKAARNVNALDKTLVENFNKVELERLILPAKGELPYAQASTIIRPLRLPGGQWQLRLVREGAISSLELSELGMEIVQETSTRN